MKVLFHFILQVDNVLQLVRSYFLDRVWSLEILRSVFHEFEECFGAGEKKKHTYFCNRTELYPSYPHMVEYTKFLLYYKALFPSFLLSFHALTFF